MKKLLHFLERLEQNKIYYRLNRIRDSILIEIAVPGERWEVEFFEDEHIEVERFKSDGNLYDGSVLEKLLEDFSD